MGNLCSPITIRLQLFLPIFSAAEITYILTTEKRALGDEMAKTLRVRCCFFHLAKSRHFFRLREYSSEGLVANFRK